MNQFYDQMFNPAYVNQNAEVQKAVKATHDLCEAVNKLDAEHQQQAFYACLTVLAGELGWNQ